MPKDADFIMKLEPNLPDAREYDEFLGRKVDAALRQTSWFQQPVNAVVCHHFVIQPAANRKRPCPNGASRGTWQSVFEETQESPVAFIKNITKTVRLPFHRLMLGILLVLLWPGIALAAEARIGAYVTGLRDINIRENSFKETLQNPQLSLVKAISLL